MYVCMYVCVYVCMYVCMYVYVYVCVYVCMYVCMYVCNGFESPDVNECETVDTSPDQTCSTEVRKRNADVDPDKNLEATRKQRDDDNAQFERFLQTQKQSDNALMLPKPEVPVFSGDPMDYQTFIRAFENLIEASTDSNSARLYYLIQYTQGDVKELMKSCLWMKGEEGFAEARRLLKRRYGQDYKIAASYVDRVTTGPMTHPKF